jgi:hypothetical protein
MCCVQDLSAKKEGKKAERRKREEEEKRKKVALLKSNAAKQLKAVNARRVLAGAGAGAGAGTGEGVGAGAGAGAGGTSAGVEGSAAFAPRVRNRRREEQRKRMKLLPPVDADKDEVFYFGQYMLFCHETYSVPSAPKLSAALLKGGLDSEDICFLCKDGGDLIECDYKHGGQKGANGAAAAACNCLKVYHEYCLSYIVPDDEDTQWCCPRHFCDSCGAKEVHFMCIYCPIAICKNCPENFVATYGLQDYLPVPRRVAQSKTAKSLVDEYGNRDTDIQLVVCETCIGHAKKVVSRGEVKAALALDLSSMSKFPGIVSGVKKQTVNSGARQRQRSGAAAAAAAAGGGGLSGPIKSAASAAVLPSPLARSALDDYDKVSRKEVSCEKCMACVTVYLL